MFIVSQKNLGETDLLSTHRTLVKSAYQKINFLISQPKHVSGTQKNRLNEMVLLSTQNIC